MTETVSTASHQPAQPPAPQAPEAGDQFAAWREKLPEDLRDAPALASYTSLEGLARSHVAAQRMIGKRIEEANPEELGRYYARHGRPESPEGYALPAPEGAEAASPELEQAARTWFHEAGLSQRQAEILHEKWNEFAGAQARDAALGQDGERARSERELRAEWGRTYDRKVASASRAVAEFGGGTLAQYLEETGLGNDPRLIRAFARIAETVGEDSLIGEGDGEGDFIISPEAAKGEITRMLREPAYFDANHPEHGASVERMRALFAAAYPEMPA